MADFFSILEDVRCYNFNTDCSKVIYHANLNTFLVITKKNEILVIDVNSSSLLHKASYEFNGSDKGTASQIDGISINNKILLNNSECIGLRGDYNGILLLDTIFQQPVSDDVDVVEIDLPISEVAELMFAVGLCKSFDTSVIMGYLGEALDSAMCKPGFKDGVVEKWNIVKLKIPFVILMHAMYNTVNELRLNTKYVQGFSISSSITARLHSLFEHSLPSMESTMMANELKRSKTFSKSINFQYVSPDQLARAGFYYKPFADGNEGAICFACGVVLSCWEATEEQCAEHAKHAVDCPYISGEYTDNVPMSTVFATAEPIKVPNQNIGTTCVSDIIPLFSSDTVTVYETSKLLKPEVVINLSTSLLSANLEDSNKSIQQGEEQPNNTSDTQNSHDTNQFYSSNAKKVYVTACSALGPSWFQDYLSELPSYEKKTNIHVGKSEIDRMPFDELKKVMPSVVVGIREVSEPEQPSPDGLKKNSDLSVGRAQVALVMYDIQYKHFENVKINNLANMFQNIDWKDNEGGKTKKISSGTIASSTNEKESYMSLTSELMDNYMDTDVDSSSVPSELHDQSFQYDYEITEATSSVSFSNAATDNLDGMLLISGLVSTSPDKTAKNSFKSNDNLPEANGSQFDLCVDLETSKNAKLIGVISLEACISDADFIVSGIYPATTGYHLLVILKRINDTVKSTIQCSGVMVLYRLKFDNALVTLESNPLCIKYLKDANDLPVDVTMLPVLQKFGGDVYKKGTHIPRAAVITSGGELKVWNLLTYDVIASWKSVEKFVSVTYCTSVEKLCVLSEHGKLHYFSLLQKNADLLYEEFGLHRNKFTDFALDGKIEQTASESLPLISSKVNFTKNDLKMLVELTKFENVTPRFTADTLSCWSEVKQGQKHRKQQPQSLLRNGDANHTRSWKLQLGPSTWSHHLLGISLPHWVYVGHVKLKFTLRSRFYKPNVQVSLLKKRDPSEVFTDISEPNAERDAVLYSDRNVNPVLTPEFHRVHNTELLCGPINLKSCLDVTERAGCVKLTSPYLFRDKCRIIIVHLRSLEEKRLYSSPLDDVSMSDSSNKQFFGCDNIAEISITVRKSKEVDIVNEKSERCNMLESTLFFENMLKCYFENTDYQYRQMALDILIWVAYIHLSRCRMLTFNCITEQLNLIYTVESYLNEIIRTGFINGDRSAAHKTVKLLTVVCEGCKTVKEDQPNQFEIILMNKLIEWLPQVLKCWSAGALRWFFYMLTNVASLDTKGFLLYQCFSLLMSISKELHKRKNRYHLILRSRFGLYGCPFDAELFDADLAMPGGYTNFIWLINNDNNTGNKNSPPQLFIPLSDGGTFWNGFTQKTINLKDLISKGCASINGNKNDISVADNVSANHFMKGLMEVELLQFTCHSASDNTKIERSQIGLSANRIKSDDMFSSVNLYFPSSSSPDSNYVSTLKKVADKEKTMDKIAFLPPSDLKTEFPNILPDEMYHHLQSTVFSKLKESAPSLMNSNFAKKLIYVSKYQMPTNQSGSTQGQLAIPPALYLPTAPMPLIQPTSFLTMLPSSPSVAGPSTQPSSLASVVYPTKLIYSDFSEENSDSSFPWQELFNVPYSTIIFAEKMRSSDKRYVVLDFGHPVILTDVIFPPYSEIVSLTISVWLNDESDGTCLAVSTDINSRVLILSDIQPPPLCQYVKISIVGLFINNSSRCRIPIGCFYGHIYTSPDDFYFEQPTKSVKSKYSLRNLSVLERMIQDLRCKYESSCSKLKNCLTPLLLNNEPNTAHMKYYLNKMKSVDDTPEITPRVTNLYHESMTYRQQLNFLISFMKRVTNTMVDPLLDQTCSLELMIGYAATSKLKLIIELLLEISLYMTYKLSIRFKEAGILYEAFNEHQISDLFNNLCIGEDPRIQLSTATLLVRLFGNCLWWSDFIVESFSFHFSSDCLKIFPRERVFALYSHLVRKSILMTGNQIHLIEHILKILLKNLAPLSQPNNLTGFLRSALDMELISWILLLLIQCMEVLPSENDTENKEPDASARWNFVYKETPIQRKKGGLERKNALRNLKKYHKKLCSSEPDKIEDFLFIADAIKETSDLLKSSTPALMKYATTTNADDVPPKKKVVGDLPPDPLQLYKQMKGIYLNSRSSGSQMNTAEDNTKGNKLRIRKQYALSVARALIAFVLHADNTCNVDMVVAVFKVLSLVIRLSASRIGMYEIIDQKQLLKLIQISTWCENARPVVGGKWISHCITCFLADFVDRVRKKFTPTPSTSSSQATKTTMIVNKDPPSDLVSAMAASLQNKKPLLSDLLWFKPPKLNPAANSSDTGNSSQLPSLLESDDSDDMEEAFDDLIHFTNQPFEIIKETNINKYPTYPSIISVAMDFRLDLKIEEQLSVIIKRNLDLTANVLGQSVASVSALTVSQRASSLFMCGTENLTLPWIIGFTVTTENTFDMLTTAFNEFLCNLNMTGTINHLEELLHMWLILCSTDLASDYSKQLPPCIPLSTASISKIISFAVSYNEISVTLWDIMFRTLTLASFLPEKPEAADSQDSTKLASFIIEHNDFSTMITSFLSKRVSGNAVGESVTKSFRDMLVQLMNYCSLNGNTNRKLDSKLKKLFIEILHHLMSPVGPIAHKRGPYDAQYVFIRTLLDVDSYEYIDLSRTPGIVIVLGSLLVSQVKETHLLKCCNVTNPVHMPSTYFDEQQFNANSTVNSAEKISSYYPPTRSYLLINIIKLVIKMTRLPHSFLYYAGSNDENSATDNSTVINNTSNKKKQYLIELILGNELAVYQLLTALSYCYTPVSDEINFQTEFFIDSAVFDKSVGDAIYNLMLYFIARATNVDLILKPLMQFLSSKCNEYYSDGLVMQLSDPLMRVITKVLSTCSIIIKFIDYGGMNIISQNLQRCFSIVMNQNHSTVSSMMQYLYGPHAFNFPLVNNRTQKKYFIERTENGLINFAPLGVITCNSMSTTSPDVLLMPGVNRRTRSPTWSYNFQSGEKSVVLKIVLPCAFLLKEVHVHPHYLSPAFPAYISIEISRNGKDYVSVDVPTETGRLAFVHVALQQPEIVLGVQLRFYKPKDMHNIGLSQICLLGYSVFGDVKSYCDPEMLNEEKLLRISIMWLNVLHHCLSREPHNPAFNKKIVSCIDQDTVDTVCGFICLPSPWPTNLVKMFQHVLISFCNFSEILGGRIIQLLLQNGCRQQLKYGKKIEPVIASNNALLILDTVCNPQDSTCTDRIEIALNWLDKACEFCLQNKSIESVTPPYVYFISTILWKVKDHDHAYKLPRIGQSIFKKLLVLSSYLPTIYSLKSVIDKTICSFCFVKPSFYLQFLEYIGVVIPDNDGSPTQVNSSNTDVETDLYDDDIQVNSSAVNSQYKLKDKSEIRLSEKDFITLSSASISSPAVRILMSTKFLYTLIQTISEFCKNECSYAEFLDTIATTDADRVNIYIPAVSVKLPLLHVNNICAILDFLSELCWDGFIRDWLGSPEVRSFWTDILLFMCQRDEMNNFNRKKFPSELVLKLEDAVIKFFCRACWCYPENQKSVVQIICKTSFNPVNWDAVASECKDGLNNFTRKLLLELILNDEKIFVAVSMEHIYDEFELRQSPGTTIYPSHPSLPCTNHQQLLYVGVDTTCSDIAKLVMTPWRDSEIYDEDKSNLDDSREYRLINDMGENCGMAVAAGFTAKDKRYKIKSLTQSAENSKNSKEHSVMVDEFFEYNTGSISQSGKVKFRVLRHAILEPQQYFSPDVSLRCILNLMRKKGNGLGTPLIKLTVALKIIQPDCFEQGITLTDPLPSLMEDFTQNGGIELIAHNIPVVCQTPVQASSALLTTRKESDSVWKKFDDFENNFFDLTDDVWDDKLDKIEKPEKSDKAGESSTPSSAAGNKMVQLENSIISVIPPHSLIAFGQFMKLPNYGAALIKDRKTAICLLRLAIGGNLDINEVINTNPELLNSLSTLPFETMGTVFKTIPLTTDHGSALRRYALHVGAIHIIFACLAVFTHHPEKIDFDGPNSKYSWLLNIIKQYYSNINIQRNEEKSNTYWAKGTGFGTGSTAQSWNVEQALNRQKLEEKHVIVFLQVLSYYINSDEVLQENPEEYYTKIMPTIREENDKMINHYELPLAFTELLSKSCLIQSLSSYVHNDSVLDVSRHVPLYLTILSLLRAMAVNLDLAKFLIPRNNRMAVGEEHVSLIQLLQKLKSCIETYSSKLKLNLKQSKKKAVSKPQDNTAVEGNENSENIEDEGLARLIPDVLFTTKIVEEMTSGLLQAANNDLEHSIDTDVMLDNLSAVSIEEQYINAMRPLQFDSYDIIAEVGDGAGVKFNVSYHFEMNLKSDAGKFFPARMKRLAQEATTLSTSLPLSYSSSVFVRCDTERLDVMKVLITGPAETPYANGCFEFDVYFPPDYPKTPMLINLETTGRHTVRFNPNLYNDGKVCLSILNTWHGRPEEKWNPQTSSFLQVLVSIQSLILVPEPYFNEPGYERSRGTAGGNQSSRDYNSNILQANVKWAMLNQIRNPSPCFKQIIQTHFWFKRQEIIDQITSWITELESDVQNKRIGKNMRASTTTMKCNLKLLCDEFERLSPPSGLEHLSSISEFQFKAPDSKFLNTSSSSSSSKATAATDPQLLPTTVKMLLEAFPIAEEEYSAKPKNDNNGNIGSNNDSDTETTGNANNIENAGTWSQEDPETYSETEKSV